MLILAIDPSGAYFEGKGTTGWAIFESEDRSLVDFGSVRAVDYPEIKYYYKAVSDLIKPEMRVVIEEYLLYATKAKQQINSKMETSKLIGYLQMYCYDRGIKVKMQLAGEVVKRWSDHILEYKGIIYRQKGLSSIYFALGRKTNEHERDAMRHAMHFITFKMKKELK